MALDLGTLFATLDIKDDGFTQKLSKAKTELQELSRTAEKAGKARVDITPKGAAEVQKAKSSASELGRELENAGKAKPNIAPTGTGSVTAAAGEARTLARELDSARQAAKQVVFPQNLSNEVGAVGKATGSLVDSLGSVSSKAIKWGAMTAGASAAAAAVGGVGTALTAGFSRLNSIDQAEAKLTGLGHSAEAITGIMDSAMASVKGTAFGFGEAAGLAGQMVASGIEPGERLTEVLTTVADTATIGGRSLEDMGLIFGSVAAKGKLQGDDLMQLMAGGIPVLQMLSDELGKTTEEVSDMASAGEIDFATFESAMRNHLGGAAQAAGDTFSGAMDNAKAAAGRLGAAFLEPMFKQAPGIIGGITDKLDEMGPAAAEFGEKAGAAMSDFAQGAIPQVKAALDTLKGSAETVWPVVQKIGDVAMGIPWQAYAGVIAMAVSKHQGLTGALSSGSGKFKAFTTEVAANRAAMQQQGSQIGVVSAAIQTLGTKSSTIGKMSQAFQSASTPLRIMGMDAREAAKQTTGLGKAAKTVQGGLSSFGGVLSGTVAGGFSLAKSGAKGLMTALGGPWGLAIGGATAVIGQLIAKHQEAKAAEEQHKAMQDSLRESLDQTTGAITAQTEELAMKSLQDSGITDIARDFGVAQDTLKEAATGSAEAIASVNSAIDSQISSSFKGSEFWQKYSTDLEKAGISMQDLVNHAMNPASQAAGELDKKLNDMAEGDDKFQHIRRDLDRAQDGFKETTEEARKFRDELGGISDDTTTAQIDQMKDSLDRFADGSNKAGEAIKLLNGEKMHLSDPEHLVVEMDPEKAAQVKSELEDIGLKAEYSSETRQLTIEFPNSGALAAALQDLQGQIVSLPDGTIDVNAMTDEAQQELVNLGLAAEIDGEVRMKDNIQSQIQRLVELGALAIVDGQLTLGDNIEVVNGKLVAVDGTKIGANLHVSDNVPQVKSDVDSLNGRNTSSTHTVWTTVIGGEWAGAYGPGGSMVDSGGTAVGQKYATGGRLPRNAAGDRIPRNATGDKNPGYRLPTTGPGTGVVDGILGVNGDGLPMSWVDAGEWIINRRSSDRWDGTLAAINQGNPSAVVAAMLADLEHHANGGKTGSQRVKEQLGPYNNGQYVMGGFSPEATDCSGAVSMGVNSYLGRDPFESRMSTVTEGQWLAERGFKEGRGDGNDLVVGWYDYGGGANGHTAMQLPDGTYIESGGNTGQGLTIGGAAGPLDGRGFTNFMYLPADEAKEREEGGLTGDLGASSDTGTGEYQSEASSASGYSAYTSSATSAATPTMPETTVNGGNGTLIKDGSALEFAAAAFSTTTGTPMPDNVVSWGQVMGTTTTRDQEETEAAIKQNEREKRANDRNIAATERELEAARQDAADKQAIYDAAAAGKGEAQAQKDLDEARQKQADAQRALDEAEADDKESKQKDLDSATEDVRKKEKALRAVADGKEAAAAKRDLDDANAKIADLEDQLEVQRENSQAYEDANNELRRSNLSPTSHRLEGTGPFGMVTDADRAATQDQITQNERELEANERNIQATQRELDAANQDVSDKEADVKNAGTVEERKEAERNLAEAKDKVGELTSKLEGQRATSEQLRQSNQNLANSVDRLSLAMVASSVIDGVSSLAGGAMNLIPMADGGVLGAARSAQINDSSAVLWAEAGPEAYIPLSSNKRARSVDIWAETGKRLGIDAISAVQLLGSGIPGLMEGRTDGFSTGGSISLDAMGLNTDAAAYMIGNAIASPVTAARTAVGGQNVTGAVFNGPVTISDPRAWAQGQANNAGKMLDTAMKGVMLR
ncbi:tape measure protein [Corynebacterium neomassiliense]|uniref:tape measure protein n=1 Tax=Corynebacterium neomassiliense TaxID=2079482 RepID=UPI001030EDD4|nr:tape measure protein [Corynebacterium neomassiliense]